jgi:hypothetical protein
MTMARKQLVDVEMTRYYHCISRCVRRAYLCGEDAVTGKSYAHRKDWIENRLCELAHIFSLDVCGFSVMDNHLHVLLRLNLGLAAGWSDEEVVRRWAKLFPPRDKTGKVLPVGEAWIAARRDDAAWVTKARQRLGDLGWFMKCLKEPLAKMANREDECTGVFFEGRFKSIAILDEASLLATCAYIDLNPVAAGKCALPEQSEHTSVKSRVEHVKSKGRLGAVTSDSPYVGSRDHEHDHWLCPIEDRSRRGAKRTGMWEGLSLTGYLKLLDWSSRLLRSGKKGVPRAAAPLLERLRIDADSWAATLQRFFSGEKLVGNFFGSVSRLQEAAVTTGRHWLKDISGRARLTAPPTVG